MTTTLEDLQATIDASKASLTERRAQISILTETNRAEQATIEDMELKAILLPILDEDLSERQAKMKELIETSSWNTWGKDSNEDEIIELLRTIDPRFSAGKWNGWGEGNPYGLEPRIYLPCLALTIRNPKAALSRKTLQSINLAARITRILDRDICFKIRLKDGDEIARIFIRGDECIRASMTGDKRSEARAMNLTIAEQIKSWERRKQNEANGDFDDDPYY